MNLQIDALKFLCEDMKPPCELSNTTFVAAAQSGQVEALQYIAQTKPACIGNCDAALHQAVLNGHTRAFDYLMTHHGAKLQAGYTFPSRWMTWVQTSAQRGHVPILDLLLMCPPWLPPCWAQPCHPAHMIRDDMSIDAVPTGCKRKRDQRQQPAGYPVNNAAATNPAIRATAKAGAKSAKRRKLSKGGGGVTEESDEGSRIALPILAKLSDYRMVLVGTALERLQKYRNQYCTLLGLIRWFSKAMQRPGSLNLYAAPYSDIIDRTLGGCQWSCNPWNSMLAALASLPEDVLEIILEHAGYGQIPVEQ